VYEVEAQRFTRCRDVLFHENKFHTFEEVTNSILFYKDNVTDDTQPNVVKDELEMPPIATEPSEDVSSVGATYEDTFYSASKKSWSNQTEKLNHLRDFIQNNVSFQNH